jgi:hypothetical protein
MAGREVRALSACCDLHGLNCEPPSELCCDACSETRHPDHPPGVMCVVPFPGASYFEQEVPRP